MLQLCMREIWKDIENTNGKYQVSNLGNIRSYIKGKYFLRKSFFNPKGCSVIDMNINTRRIVRSVHRIVAEHFLPNIQNKPQVNHIDGNKNNNIVTNLEWVTNQENQDHANKLGLYKNKAVGTRNGNSKLTPDIVRQIRRDKLTYRQMSVKYNLNPSTILRIKKYILWKHIK